MSKKRVRSPKQLQRPSEQLGVAGEAQACTYLQLHGYHILATNFTDGHHEIDIVALDIQSEELVFCEVKTRSSSDFGHPTKAVGYKKTQSLRQAARRYCQQHQPHATRDFRFDIICVVNSRVEHFENVTW